MALGDQMPQFCTRFFCFLITVVSLLALWEGRWLTANSRFQSCSRGHLDSGHNIKLSGCRFSLCTGYWGSALCMGFYTISLRRVNEIMSAKRLAQCLAYIKGSNNRTIKSSRIFNKSSNIKKAFLGAPCQPHKPQDCHPR